MWTGSGNIERGDNLGAWSICQGRKKRHLYKALKQEEDMGSFLIKQEKTVAN